MVTVNVEWLKKMMREEKKELVPSSGIESECRTIGVPNHTIFSI